MELYKAWRNEDEEGEIQPLTEDFYPRVNAYLRELRDEVRLADEKSLKSRLTRQELERARIMLEDLISTRYRKMVESIMLKRIPVNKDRLVGDEKVLCDRMLGVVGNLEELVNRIMEEKVFREAAETRGHPRTVTVRFMQVVPAIVGVDMKKYGPFKAEDVASVPVENAETLVKHGFAKMVVTREDS